MLNYNNYVYSKTDSKFVSRYSLIDLQRTRQNENREFVFTVVPEPLSINSQAEAFANYFVAEGRFEYSLLDNANRLETPREILRSTYVYSYLKSLYYSVGRNNGLVSAMMSPNNNLVFHGHKVLHDMIIEGYMQHLGPNNTCISMQINFEEDFLTELESFDVWTNSYDTITGRLFNATYETALGFLNKRCTDVLSITNLSDVQDISARSLASSPLGNMSYSANMSQLLYIESNAIVSDRISYFWNKAVMIGAITIPPIDADDEIYDTVNAEDYDSTGIFFEVESITGFNPLGSLRTSHDVSSSNIGPDGNGLPDDDTLTGIPRGGSSTSTAMSRRSKGGKKPIPHGSGNNGGFRSKVVKVKNQAVDLFRRIDTLLDDERATMLMDIISDIKGRKFKKKAFKKYVGLTINQVLAEFDLNIESDLTGVNGDYSAFYLEEDGNKVRLTGIPRNARSAD